MLDLVGWVLGLPGPIWGPKIRVESTIAGYSRGSGSPWLKERGWGRGMRGEVGRETCFSAWSPGPPNTVAQSYLFELNLRVTFELIFLLCFC